MKVDEMVWLGDLIEVIEVVVGVVCVIEWCYDVILGKVNRWRCRCYWVYNIMSYFMFKIFWVLFFELLNICFWV